MITKEQLEEIEFSTTDGTSYTDAPNWEYKFNIKTQELYVINDGFGDPEFICRCTNIEHLKQIIEILNK